MPENKPTKLIIPKIKTNCPPSPKDHFPSQVQNTPQIKSKTEKKYFLPESASHSKNFPKQQELQKMTKKELTQTYYQQFLRLRKENEVLDKQLAFVRQERDLLYKRYSELKEEQRNSEQQRPKRQRRVATQIQRNCKCPIKNCEKSYGSEGSLIQHIKIKHEQFYNTDEYHLYLNKKKQEI